MTYVRLLTNGINCIPLKELSVILDDGRSRSLELDLRPPRKSPPLSLERDFRVVGRLLIIGDLDLLLIIRGLLRGGRGERDREEALVWLGRRSLSLLLDRRLLAAPSFSMVVVTFWGSLTFNVGNRCVASFSPKSSSYSEYLDATDRASSSEEL